MTSWLSFGGRRLLEFHKMCFPRPSRKHFLCGSLGLLLQDVGVIGSGLVACEVVVATPRVALQGLGCCQDTKTLRQLPTSDAPFAVVGTVLGGLRLAAGKLILLWLM